MAATTGTFLFLVLVAVLSLCLARAQDVVIIPEGSDYTIRVCPNWNAVTFNIKFDGEYYHLCHKCCKDSGSSCRPNDLGDELAIVGKVEVLG